MSCEMCAAWGCLQGMEVEMDAKTVVGDCLKRGFSSTRSENTCFVLFHR